MAFAFDPLGYAKRLRDAGVVEGYAEAHAEAARDFIMTELVIKTDLYAVKSELLAAKSELMAAIEKSALQTTVRLGGIVAVGIGILAALQRIH
ncbi:MAG: hypothetical protein ABW213_10320 [Tardiphaga sp.]